MVVEQKRVESRSAPTREQEKAGERVGGSKQGAEERVWLGVCGLLGVSNEECE